LPDDTLTAVHEITQVLNRCCRAMDRIDADLSYLA
jgi:hypothetical protein